MDRINQKAKEHWNLLEYTKINIEEFFGSYSKDDINVIYECLDALKDGNFTNDCFEKLKSIEGKRGISYWRKIKELLIAADYMRKRHATI